MAANKRKILEAARKLAQKGAKAKALKEYQKLVKLDPKDAKLRLEIGDAYRRWGQVEEAIETYSKVADQYTKEGFDARAVAVFKQILNLDPARYESYEPLAELYERMGLTSEAINALQTAADGFHRQGKKREALDLLRKMATIDPTNTTSRIKVAELLRQEELHSEAIAEYDHVSQELERQGDVESCEKVYKRVLEIDPDRTVTLVKLARNLLARGGAEQAEPFAVHALETADGEPDHYELLAEVYREQNKNEEMSDVYRRLAELYRQRGDEDQARDIQQRYVPAAEFSAAGDDATDLAGGAVDGGEFIDSGDLSADEILLDKDMLEASASNSLSGQAPVLETDDPSADPIGIPELEESATPVDPALSAPSHSTPPPASTLSEDADPEQLLAEASVYLRYGKRDRAVAHLEQILASEPDHRLALEKLGEAYVESGDDEKAVELFMRSVKRAREDDDEAAVAVLRARIAALDANAAASLDPPTGSDPDPEDSLDELSSDLDEDDDLGLEAEIDSDAFEVDIDVEDDLDAAEPAASEADEGAPGAEPQTPTLDTAAVGDVADTSVSGASLSSSTTQQALEDLEEADFYMQQGLLDEAEEIYKRVLSVAPNHPRALARLGEVAAERGTDSIPAGADAVDDAPTLVETPTPIATQGTADGADAEVDEEISIDESAAPLTEPSDDLSDLDVDDVVDEDAPTEDDEDTGVESLGTDESPGSVSPEAAPGPGDGFDLAAEITGALDDDAAGTSFTGGSADDGFSAVFEAFKQGVSETLSEGDHDTHYDLGIAYKEMGLLDDAIQEFRVAMKSPSRRVECLHLVGLCALEAGQPQLAAENFTEQLESPGLSDEQKLAGRFELGRAYQAMGDIARARTALQAVAALDPSFCDVEELLEELDAAQPSDESVEGDYESFEDVVGDVSDKAGSPAPDPGETFDDLVAEANADPPDEAQSAPAGSPDKASPDSKRSSGKPAAPRPKRKKKKISFV